MRHRPYATWHVDCLIVPWYLIVLFVCLVEGEAAVSPKQSRKEAMKKSWTKYTNILFHSAPKFVKSFRRWVGRYRCDALSRGIVEGVVPLKPGLLFRLHWQLLELLHNCDDRSSRSLPIACLFTRFLASCFTTATIVLPAVYLLLPCLYVSLFTFQGSISGDGHAFRGRASAGDPGRQFANPWNRRYVPEHVFPGFLLADEGGTSTIDPLQWRHDCEVTW